MKIKICALLLSFSWAVSAHSADLDEVYQQALCSDPTFQQAVAQRLATKENVPISAASILPNLALTFNPSITRTGFAGSLYQSTTGSSANTTQPRNNTQRAYDLALTLQQTVFDFGKFSALSNSYALSKGADATLNAALQNLMLRVAAAYFSILLDEDNVAFTEASKKAYYEQLEQSREQYKVGLKTVTDVYTAQAAYEASVALYIGAKTTLSNDRENLRVITGVYYDHLAPLSEKFPLVKPNPSEVDLWVKSALAQNWTIKSSQYSVEAARDTVHQAFAGHLPTLNVVGVMDRQYTNNINNYNTFNVRNGPGTQSDRSVQLNLTVPLFSGGGVTAQTNQATYNYEIAQQGLEQTIRSTINVTRQSYLNVVAGISQISADQLAIKSAISSLEGIRASYRVGTETLVDVLNQQQKVLQNQTKYATDRYAYVNNILTLKQAAGTLSFDDLHAVNKWLLKDKK